MKKICICRIIKIYSPWPILNTHQQWPSVALNLYMCYTLHLKSTRYISDEHIFHATFVDITKTHRRRRILHLISIIETSIYTEFLRTEFAFSHQIPNGLCWQPFHNFKIISVCDGEEEYLNKHLDRHRDKIWFNFKAFRFKFCK